MPRASATRQPEPGSGEILPYAPELTDLLLWMQIGAWLVLRAGWTIRFCQVVDVGALCSPKCGLLGGPAHIGGTRPLPDLLEYT